MACGESVVYRLHRLAEIGYCASLGRFDSERERIRLEHPKSRHPDLVLEADGSVCVTPSGQWIEVGDAAQFEAFIRSIGETQIGFRSRYVYEEACAFIAHAVFGAVGLGITLAVVWILRRF